MGLGYDADYQQCERTFWHDHGNDRELWIRCLQSDSYRKVYSDADLDAWYCSLFKGHTGPHVADAAHDPAATDAVVVWHPGMDLDYDPFGATR